MKAHLFIAAVLLAIGFTLCALPNFHTVFFETEFSEANVTGKMWWDPTNFRSRVDSLITTDKLFQRSLAVCNKQLNQIEGYEIVDNIPFNFTMCAKRVLPGCTYDNFGSILGRQSGYSAIVSEAVGVSMSPNGTSDDCTFPGTTKCLRFSEFGPGCDVASEFEWVLSQTATPGAYYPDVSLNHSIPLVLCSLVVVIFNTLFPGGVPLCFIRCRV